MSRVAVERGAQSVTLVLAQWRLANTATLTYDEAAYLIRLLQEALTPVQPVHRVNTLPDIL